MKKRKKARNRLLIFGSFSAFVILFFLIQLAGFIFQVKDLNDTQQEITSQIYELKNEEDYLKNEIVKLKDPDYLARYARENYMYSKDGEYIIKVPEVKERDTASTLQNKNNIGIIAIISGGLFILIVILKKIF